MPALTASGIPDVPHPRVPLGSWMYDPYPSAQLMAEVYLAADSRYDLVHIQSAGNHLWRLLRVDAAILSNQDEASRAGDAQNTPATALRQTISQHIGAVYTTDQLSQLAGLVSLGIYAPADDLARLVPPACDFLSILIKEESGVGDYSTLVIWGHGYHFVSISYWLTGAGGFGHIGIAVDSDKTEGFSTLDPKMGKLKRFFWHPAAGVEDDERAHTSKTKHVAPHVYLHRSITAESAKAMKMVIARRSVNPGTYNLFVNNCARFVEDVLRAGGVRGVPHAEVFGPAILGGVLWYEDTWRDQ